MTGTFVKEGWRRLLDQVGEGNLTGKLRVDQVYARYQHERGDLSHPRGGQAKYLSEPFMANYRDYLARVARSFLDGDPERTMAQCMESLATRVGSATPVLFSNLRRSGNPQVFSNGSRVYDRPARQRRMSEQELRAQRRGRGRRR
jgi:hypothetical protein